ncbi:MAG: hypothetical protein ACREQZ_07885 [Woeseiaceae bacterium]
MIRPGLVKAFFLLSIALYPFIVYFGLSHFPPSFFGLMLLVLVASRYGVLQAGERPVLLPVIAVFAAYAVAASLLGSATMLLYYPALVNGCLCAVFLNSLRQGEPLLLTVVKARGWPISRHGPTYLYWLTAVWAGFFVLNGMISLWTVGQPIETWTLYNGFLSYLLIAVLAVGEWLFRRRFKRRMGVEP